MRTQSIEGKKEESFNSLKMDSEIAPEKNFDIKSNLKANYGVVYSEGMSYIDQGPNYEDQNGICDDIESIRYSIKDYKDKHQKQPMNTKLGEATIAKK